MVESLPDGSEFSSGSPGIKAGSALDTLAYLDVYRPGSREQVLERMPPDVRDRFVNASRTEWLPYERDRHFVEAIVEVFGRHGAVDFVRSSVERHFDSALLSTVVHGAMRLFGLNPSGLLRMLPRAWPMVYRNVAKPRIVEYTSNTCTVVFEEFHPGMLESSGYQASVEGLLWGVLDVCKRDGEVHFEVDPAHRQIRAEVRWPS